MPRKTSSEREQFWRRHIEQQRREVFVGDNGTVNREDERLLAELWNVLQDAPQVGQFHVGSLCFGQSSIKFWARFK